MTQTAVSESQRLRRQLEAVGAAILALGAGRARALEEVLQRIATAAREATDATYAALGIGSDPERPFSPLAISGMAEQHIAAIEAQPRPIGIRGLIAREKQTIRVPDVRQHPAFAGFPPRHPEVTSFLGVPIADQERSIGALYVANKLAAHEFTPEDERVLELLASLASIAVRQFHHLDDVQEEYARLRTFLEGADLAIVFIETETGRLLANQAARRMLGEPLRPEAGLAQLVGRIRRPDGRPLTEEELLGKALQGESIEGQEVLVTRDDASRVSALASATPIRGAHGRIIGAALFLHDITASKELERMREEWTSIIAHDLRQPVTVIAGYASILARLAEQPDAPPQLKTGVEHIQASARQLNRMINDLQDATRVEAGRIELERRPTDLLALVRAATERIAATAADRRIRLSVKGSIPTVVVDPDRIDQVLANLLSNAVKHGYPNTDILVDVTSLDGEVEVAVTNYGEGIPPEEMPRIFSRFHRIPRRPRSEGLGLGLYICRGLVQAHGGRITVESEPGKTTTFRFTLPVDERQPPTGGS